MEAVAEKQKFAFHELEGAIQAVFTAMDEAENPDDPIYQEALEGVLAELADAEASKADAIAFMLAQLEAQAEAIGITMMGLANRKAAMQNKVERLRTYTLRTMQNYGLTKIKGQSATLSIRKGSESVIVDSVEELPFDMTVIKTEADKKVIREALRAGKEVPGARLVQGPESLMVRR